MASASGLRRVRLVKWGSLVLAAASLCPLGCKGGAFDWTFLFGKKRRGEATKEVSTDPLFNSAAYRDSVAEYAYFDGLRRLRVRGYGVVVGLGRNGSSQCPRAIARGLTQEMYKTRQFAQRAGQAISPERLLEDMDTAVVAVEGEIPAGAPSGARFDLVVRALPGTETVSLEGGTLYECDLKVFRPRGSQGWIPGKALATGAGPIFLNPFGRSEDAATKPNLRQGIVIGGGLSEEDRRLRLLLTTPSYPMAIRIAEVINERFGRTQGDVADPVSPGEIRVYVPHEYRHDPKHFVALVQHLYPLLRSEFLVERVRELGREFESPDAPRPEIALAWEAIGRDATSEVQKFYTHLHPDCNFYAAAAGVLLGDELAVETLEAHLSKETSGHRFAAIRALGAARGMLRAARPLRRALDDPDPRICTAAYEALRRRADPTITSVEIGDGAFSLDLVPSEAENLIYVKRSEARRIALFGAGIAARPPLFYSDPDSTLIIDASASDSEVRIVRRSRVSGVSSPPMRVPLGIARLIAFLGDTPPRAAGEPLRGVGVDYAGITRALAELCEAKAM